MLTVEYITKMPHIHSKKHYLKEMIRPIAGRYFWPRYWLSRTQSFFSKRNEPVFDYVFIVAEHTRGWILEAICKEIAAHISGTVTFHYSVSNLPPAKIYFISHYSMVPVIVRKNPSVLKSKILVWYTHPRKIDTGDRELIYVLNRVHKVICTCSEYVKKLVQMGLEENKVTCVLGGADPDFFYARTRSKDGKIGFCSGYRPHKSPDLILNIIKAMPHRKFLLVGREWSKSDRFSEMIGLQNFEYVEAPYKDYPRLYAQMDVFVSPSRIEGGPIPLLEAMMANVVPVASNTGFAPDLIIDGQNGFLFDIDKTSLNQIVRLIEKAFELEVNVRATVSHLCWRNFSKQIQDLTH